MHSFMAALCKQPYSCNFEMRCHLVNHTLMSHTCLITALCYFTQDSGAVDIDDESWDMGLCSFIPLLLFVIGRILAPIVNVLSLMAAVIIYLCSGGDTKPFQILPVVPDPTWQLGLWFYSAACRNMSKVFRHLCHSQPPLAWTIFLQKLSDSAAAVNSLCSAIPMSFVYAQQRLQTLSHSLQRAGNSTVARFRCALQFRIYLQKIADVAKQIGPSVKHRRDTIARTAKHIGLSVKHTYRAFGTTVKHRMRRSFEAIPRTIDQFLCHGYFTTVSIILAAVLLLITLESRPLQTLQAVTSASVVLVTTAALCEVSDASNAVDAVLKQLTAKSPSTAHIAFTIHSMIVGCTRILKAGVSRVTDPSALSAAVNKAAALTHNSARSLGCYAKDAAVLSYQAWATAWSIVSGSQKSCGSGTGSANLAVVLAGSDQGASLLRGSPTGLAQVNKLLHC